MAVKRLNTLQPSYQMQNISFCQVWACPEGKFQFQDLSTLAPLLFFWLFLPHLFSSAGHLVVFNSVEKIFGKTFRILKLHERKGSWVMQQILMGIFDPMLHVFLPFSLASLTEFVLIILVWFERSPHPASVTCNWQTCLWLLKMITSQVVQGTWISMGGSGTLYSGLSRSKMASLSWVTTHPYYHAFTVQKFRWLWCSQPACQIFNRTGYIFDLWIFGI